MSTRDDQKNGIQIIHEFDIDAENFIVYLFGFEDHPDDGFIEPGVEYRLSNRFIRNLNYLSSKDSKRPILVLMKTCGGDWEEGLSIFDAIRACPNHVTIINYTHARSMSSIILQSADRRVMLPNSTFMFHSGTFEFSGTHKQLQTEFKQNNIAMEKMLDIYIESMKEGILSRKTEAQIRRWLLKEMNQKEEVYLSAEQTVEYGFADEIFTQWTDYLS